MKSEQWIWMMNWCRKNFCTPNSPYFWNKAEEEYEKFTKSKLLQEEAKINERI